MTKLDRRIAGMTCAEVLADLSPYMDGELQPSRVQQLRAHLSECHECDRFGALVAHVLGQLRAGEPEAMPPAVRSRVVEQVKRRISSDHRP